MEPISLNENIRHFYDSTARLWLDTWGEHMHHGWYGEDGTAKKNHRQAQVDLIRELLEWGGVRQASSILDAGCGVGGCARFLAQAFGAKVLGLTLSPVQAAEAQHFNKKAGLENKISIQVRDMMSLTRADGKFDLIWSLESAEHIAGKKRLLEIFYALLEPGGRFLLVTWCSRESPQELPENEQALLKKLGKSYNLPPFISIRKYEELARDAGFQNIQTADWSKAVAPFWFAVIRSALHFRGIAGLLRSGLTAIEAAFAMRLMVRGYRLGTIQFAVIQGQKPA